jgi:HupE / UreJ protein
MTSGLRRCVGALVVALVWLACCRPALAHGLHPGVLTLLEQEPGVFGIVFTEPVDTSGASTTVDVVLPEHCRRDGAQVGCTPGGLHGAITVDGLTAGRSRVMVLVRFLDGRVVEAMLTAERPELRIDEAPGRSVTAWVLLGVEHVLGGLDHLAFVLGLLLVVGIRGVRRLALTITAFTVAHSLTLALAATGVLVLSPAPVEAMIAASVVLVAREATHEQPTLTRRAPWAVAFAFGLVHGLGFAGALRSSLPAGVLDGGGLDAWLAWSLVWFNLGIELAQLAVVVAVVLLIVVARRLVGPRLLRLRLLAVYAIGGLGAWWLLERTLAVVTARS